MRDIIIMSEEGYLGKHSPFLGVGNTQSMVFKADDDCGPWYLTPDQQDLHLLHHDKTTGKSKVAEKQRRYLMLQQKQGLTKAELQD